MTRDWGLRLVVSRPPWQLITGAVILLLVFAAVLYSVVFKRWCDQYERGWNGQQQAWGDTVFGEDTGPCVRNKSVFSF